MRNFYAFMADRVITELRRGRMIIAFLFLVIAGNVFAQVSVTATAGTMGPTPYTTLKAAFDAINAGTHQGAVVISISGNTTETAAAVLNSSGYASALYTSVLIHPTVDGVTISGAGSGGGRGLIELQGADNVTIEGDNSNTAGINRNLTIQNTSTATFHSVIRIATATTVVMDANNNTFQNLNLIGGAVGRNISTANTTTGTENTVFGILAGSGANTTPSNTAQPSNVTSVTAVIGSPVTMTNLLINNNAVTNVARAISLNGSAATVFTGTQVTNNLIGNPTTGAVDGVYAVGITIGGATNPMISGNTVYVEGFVGSGAGLGIAVGTLSANTTGATIQRNTIGRSINNNIGTWTAVGINLAGGNNHVVRNNCVTGVLNSQVAGTGAFGPSFGATGIRAASGTGHLIHYNSVHLTGSIPGVISTNVTSAFAISGTGVTGLDVRNNIFSNQLTGGNPTLYNTVHVSMFLPSGATSALNLNLNNNVYYQGTTPQNGIAQVGTTGNAANLYLAANFNPASTAPATNLRAYTSTLSVSGTNDNASFASSLTPPFISATNLHVDISNPNYVDLEGKATPIAGITTDFDNDPRNGVTPDIGYDEFAALPCVNADGGVVTPASTSLCAGQSVVLTSSGASSGSGTVYQWMVTTTSGSGYVNVSGGSGANTTSFNTGALNTPGTFYYVLQTTCSNGPFTDLSNEVSVLVNPAQSAAITPSAPTICAGQSVSLTESAGTATSWLWSPGGATSQAITVSPLTTTTYSVVATGPGGCNASANATVTVTEAPTITSFTADATQICEGDIATLSVSATGGAPIHSSGQINLAIPDGVLTGVSHTIPVSGAGTLNSATDLVVTLTFGTTATSPNREHTWTGDVKISLTSPGGTTVIFDRPGVPASTFGNSDDMNGTYTFNVNAANTWPELTGTFATGGNINNGSYKPTDSSTPGVAHNWSGLTFPFNGNGNWTLTVIDHATPDTGDLLSWSISLPGTYVHQFIGPDAGPTVCSNPDCNSATSIVTGTTLGTSNYTVQTTSSNGCIATSSSIAITVDPSGCIDPGACNYDPAAVCDDNSCTYDCIPGEEITNPIVVQPGALNLNTCSEINGDLTGSLPSDDALTVAITGEDEWYAFTANGVGVRIYVESASNDLLLELQDSNGNLVDSENLVAGPGDEGLNVTGLTPGDTYYLGVRNYDSSQGIGTYSVCIQTIMDSQCDYGPGPYTLCQTFKADWVGPYVYTFHFTSTTTNTTYTKVNGASTFVVLSTVPGLQYNDTYDVDIDVTYTVPNGTGNETIVVESDNPCQIVVSPQPLAVLRPSDNCVNHAPHFLGNTIAAQPFVCGATDWLWEFTRTDVAELPIYHYRGAATRFLTLTSVPGLVPGGTYSVRVAPVVNGVDGLYGAADCLQILGPGGMILDGSDSVDNNAAVKEDAAEMIEVALYPNPNTGEMINLNLSGVESDVVLVDMYDSFGRMVYSAQFVVDGSLNTIVTFDETLAGGMYLMNITMDEKVMTERFIVER